MSTGVNRSGAVRIGGASGFWAIPPRRRRSCWPCPASTTSSTTTAETTMSIPARARGNPALGYATDFVQAAMAPHLREIRHAACAWWPTPAVSIRTPAAMR